MGNKLTNELLQHIDERLMDIAQMHEGIDYGDILKFAKKADKAIIKQIKKLIKQYEEEEGEDEKTIQAIIDYVLVIIQKKLPIDICEMYETINNSGKQTHSKSFKIIKNSLLELSDDMVFIGAKWCGGSYYADDLVGKVVQVGTYIFVVPKD